MPVQSRQTIPWRLQIHQRIGETLQTDSKSRSFVLIATNLLLIRRSNDSTHNDYIKHFLTMSNSFFKQKLSQIKPGDPIDYKDVDLLKKFITDRGKILPRRLTGLTAKQQRDLTTAVKRARIVALLPFVNPEG